jgi:hypothetical protein
MYSMGSDMAAKYDAAAEVGHQIASIRFLKTKNLRSLYKRMRLIGPTLVDLLQLSK